MSFNFDQSGKTHPEDFRNMIIFVIAAVLIWLAFDHFLLKPRAEAMKQQVAIQAELKAKAPEEAKPRPREAVLAEGERITIEGAEISGSLPLTGIRIDDITLKNYELELGKPEKVVLMAPAGSEHPQYAEIGWLADDTALAVPGRTTTWTLADKGDFATGKPAVFTWSNGQGLEFSREISLDRHYMFQITQKVKNTSDKAVTLYPYASLARRGIPPHPKGIGYEGPLGYIGDKMQEIEYGDLKDQGEVSFSSPQGWIGISQKYWLASLIPDQTKAHVFRFSTTPDPDPTRSLYQVDTRGVAMTIEPQATAETTSHLYVGAKRVNLLDSYEDKLGVRHFDLAVDFGSLYFLTRPLYFLLNLFNSWVANFGVAILMLTVVVRLAVFPLANASYKSFAKLKKVSPQMAELRVRYSNDKPRLQQELIKLYETEKVNPMAGCFPLLLQIPIFFAVYKVISIAIEMRHAPFFGWIQDLSERDPLSVFNLFGLLPFDLPGILMIGPWSVAMLLLMLVQKKMNPPPQDQIQRDIANYLPWIMTFVLSSFPSGLVMYWTFSNLISVIQQYVIMKMMGVPVYLFEKEKAKAYEEHHAKKVTEATERAKADVEKTKTPVKESLFEDGKPS